MLDYCDIFSKCEHLHALYVEDDTDVAQEVSEILRDFFATVTVVEDGEEGLKEYKLFYHKNKNFMDIVLTDINMPILNGLDMSKKIRQLNPAQRIIIITAMHDPDYSEELKNMGIEYIIKKPITTKELLLTLSQASTDLIS